MNRCFACDTLVGMPSTVTPHASLQRIRAEVVGPPAHTVTRYVQYRCNVCGSWIHQNTLDGSQAGLWSAGAPQTGAENNAFQVTHNRRKR